MQQPTATSNPRSPETIRPGPRARKCAATRERLFQAALDEFRQRGIPATRIEHIARRAQVVRGTFYFHFPSKDHVLEELRLRCQKQLLLELEQLDPKTVSISELIETLLNGVERADKMVADTGLMQVALAVYVRHALRKEPKKEKALLAIERIEILLTGIARRGALRRDVSPDALANLLLTSIFGIYCARRAEARTTTIEGWKQVMARGLEAP